VKILSSPAARVKSQNKLFQSPAAKTPIETQLVPVLLRRGEREEFFHLPLCHVCHEPILDFDEANVCVIGFDLTAPQGSLEPLGTLDGAKMFRLPGTAVVVHFGCDEHEWKPWVRSSSVFSRDQRSPIEKLGWSGVGS
jgi:hypothetical protein